MEKNNLLRSIFLAFALILTFAFFTACGESEKAKLYSQRCIEAKSIINNNPTEGLSLLMEGAQNGHVKSQAYIGVCYMNIGGYEVRGAEWIRKAAEAGDALSQYNLALCYKHGIGFSQNLENAVFWAEKAEKNGYTDAVAAINRSNSYRQTYGLFKY